MSPFKLNEQCPYHIPILVEHIPVVPKCQNSMICMTLFEILLQF